MAMRAAHWLFPNRVDDDPAIARSYLARFLVRFDHKETFVACQFQRMTQSSADKGLAIGLHQHQTTAAEIPIEDHLYRRVTSELLQRESWFLDPKSGKKQNDRPDSKWTHDQRQARDAWRKLGFAAQPE